MNNLTGIELIAQERQEQIEKHKWNDTENTWYLLELAKYNLLDDDNVTEKDNIRKHIINNDKENNNVWPGWFTKFDFKTKIERLTVAGALIAAEIDRLNKIENNEQSKEQ